MTGEKIVSSILCLPIKMPDMAPNIIASVMDANNLSPLTTICNQKSLCVRSLAVCAMIVKGLGINLESTK